jgi:hypothetical protein
VKQLPFGEQMTLRGGPRIPVGELLAAGEGAHVEYQSTLRTGADTGELIKPMETAVLKTVAAFANSATAAPC